MVDLIIYFLNESLLYNIPLYCDKFRNYFNMKYDVIKSTITVIFYNGA